MDDGSRRAVLVGFSSGGRYAVGKDGCCRMTAPAALPAGLWKCPLLFMAAAVPNNPAAGTGGHCAGSRWHVVFGGSFNPIHVGHQNIVRQLCLMPEVDKLYVVPNGLSPGRRKTDLLPWDVRLGMVQAGLAEFLAEDSCKLVVSDVERPHPDGNTPSYTLETLKHLRSAGGDEVDGPGSGSASLWALVVGEDQARFFPRWRDSNAILEAAALWVIPRPGNPSPAAAEPAATDTRIVASEIWAGISTLLDQSEGTMSGTIGPLLFDPKLATASDGGATTARATVRSSDGGAREVYRWLAGSNLALSSTQIRAGLAGIEMIPAGARPLWQQWQRLHQHNEEPLATTQAITKLQKEHEK